MGDLPLPGSSGAGVLSLGIAPSASEPSQAPAKDASRDIALIGVLREAAMTGPQSADSILNALADAARVLCGADGTAIASRNDGIIVCRARSGDMAPGLGAPLNSDSGISGECLRTASMQICNDTSTDARVDSEACQALGIRSVAVVPLLGRMGMFGILEAFSARTDAFEEEQINSLRSLAEIAEMAYERERNAANTAEAISTVCAALSAAAVRADLDEDRARSSGKRYLILGGIAVALFAMAWIARMSWRQTGAEIAASTSTAPAVSTSTAPALQLVATEKPNAALAVHTTDRARTKVLENAAAIDSETDTPTPLTPSKNPPLADMTAKNEKLASAETVESAPSVQVAFGTVREQMPRLAAEKSPLPQFGGAVSQAVPATALQRVNPIYPPLARSQGIGGDVILDATISKEGLVPKVKIISGAPSLADAATKAVRQWRFSPAMLNGKPVEVEQRITIVFKLP
jgi:TonB family protein